MATVDILLRGDQLSVRDTAQRLARAYHYSIHEAGGTVVIVPAKRKSLQLYFDLINTDLINVTIEADTKEEAKSLSRKFQHFHANPSMIKRIPRSHRKRAALLRKVSVIILALAIVVALVLLGWMVFQPRQTIYP